MARQLGTIENPNSSGRRLTQPSLAEKIWGGLSGVVGSIEQPFVSLAAKPVQIAAKAAGLKDPYAQGIPAGLPGANTTVKPSAPTASGITGDTLKAGSTIASFAIPGGGIARSIATGAGIGAGTFAGTALQEEKSGAEVIKQGGIGALIGGATAGVFAGIGKLAGAVGDKIMKTIIKPTKADIEDGFTIQTIKDYNLGGSLNKTLTKTQDTISKLADKLNQKLAGSTNKIDLESVYKETVSELTDASKLKGFGANKQIVATLQKLKEEIGIVNQQGGLSIPEAQVIKQAAGNFGAWQFGKPDPDAKATEIVFNMFYNKLKNNIEKLSPEGVRELNKELSRLIPVQNAIIRRLPIAERSNAISLNEMIGLAASSINPIALGPTLLALLSRSGTAANALSKVGPAIGKGAVPAAFAISQLAEQVPGIVPEQLQSSQQSSSNNTQQAEQRQLGERARNIINRISPAGPAGLARATGGTVAKIAATKGITAVDTMKDALIRELSKAHQTVPKAGTKIDLNLIDETEQFIKFLKEVPNPTLAQMNRGLELVKLHGGNARAIADEVLKNAQTQFTQLRDLLGRFTSK